MMFLFERAGWVECWTVPSVVFTIDYSWHPIYPQKADEQLKQSCKCHYLFLVSMFHFRICCDFFWIQLLKFAEMNFELKYYYMSYGRMLIFRMHQVWFKNWEHLVIQNFRTCPSSLCKRRILSVFHFLFLTKWIS